MERNKKISVLFLLAFAIVSCAGGKKLAVVKENGITAAVAAGSLDNVIGELPEDTVSSAPQVVEVQDLQGNRIIMNAVRDEESGEMVASEQLQEIVVQATFKHVAERNGVIDLVFELLVPVELQDNRWQVRFTPEYRFLGDTLKADKVLVTGERFRRIQDWGYSMYGNYMEQIVPQEEAQMLYAREKLSRRFIQRYGDDMAEQAGEHYRMKILEAMNRNRYNAQGRIYDRFVRDPYPSGGVRLDSVVLDKATDGMRYYYVQSINTRPGLKRVEMVMKGEVFTNGRKLCSLVATEPVTFYISSISSFTDNSERYMKKVVSRDLHLSTFYNIGFAKGKWSVEHGFGNNADELVSIRRNIAEILENEDFVMDSLLITAGCSPEGKFHVNEKLSRQRGNSIKEYVVDYVARYRDSVSGSVWEINEDKTYREEEKEIVDFDEDNIAITNVSEDWETLRNLVASDTLLHRKEDILACWEIYDWDTREKELLRNAQAAYIMAELYPQLRRVKFNFKLHRKGMLKDTVHTTELDTVYMSGVQALRDRDYKKAVTVLRPYNCYNTAVAYVCMDYNSSALEILNTLPRDARRDYMLAVVHSRLGNERLAVEYYLASVEQDDSMRHRGNLDPEISSLIKKYGIFNN